jgi:hypothetical protein
LYHLGEQRHSPAVINIQKAALKQHDACTAVEAALTVILVLLQ